MGVKGDKWRGGWTPQYADNHNKIFGGKMKEDVPAKMYLEMWLSEQIPTQDWLEILKERNDVKDLYHTHLENKNG